MKILLVEDDFNVRLGCEQAMQLAGIPVIAVATLDDIMAFLGERPDFKAYEAAVARYRQEYGVARAG